LADKISSNLIPRREFASRAVFASVLASLAPSQLLPASAPDNTEQEQPHPNLPKLSPESEAEADARLQNILSQYGSRFSDEQKADLRRLCIVAQAPLDRLRAYAVENGDDPALYLKPLVEREKKPSAQPVSGENSAVHQKS
jgi:hypothetical protein